MDRKRVNEVGESIAIRVNEVTRLVSLGIESTKGGDELTNQEQKPSELLGSVFSYISTFSPMAFDDWISRVYFPCFDHFIWQRRDAAFDGCS